MKAPYFEVFEDSDGDYRWHLKSANGRVIAQGESHSRERDAWRAVETVIATAYAFVDEDDDPHPVRREMRVH